MQHCPPETSSEWVRLPGGDMSHRGIDFLGQILTNTGVQRLVRKGIDGNTEMTGY